MRFDADELGAAVAIGTAGRATADVVPVHAHKPLPVRVITEVVHSLAEKRIQNGKVLPDFRAGAG